MTATIGPSALALERAEAQWRQAARGWTISVWSGRLCLGLGFVVAWQIASGTILDPGVVARPTSIAVAWWELASNGQLWANARVTLFEFLCGYAAGACTGIVLACLLTVRPLTYRLAEPFLFALYGIPMVATGPIVVVWFGLGVASKIVLAALGTWILVLVTTVGGIRSLDPRSADLFRLLGANERQIYLRLVLPHALPFIVTALRLAIPIAMIGTILAELLGATAGLGHMLAEQGTFLAVDKMMATLATIAACVIVFRLWLLPLERWIARQQGIMKTGGT